MNPTCIPWRDVFAMKIYPKGDCWEWRGAKTDRGYGSFSLNSIGVSGNLLAHRMAYEIGYGITIPQGMNLDHLCNNPWCVRPSHLMVVTPRQNTLRGNSAAAKHARKTACLRGHLFSGANLVINNRGDRVCRTCQKVRELAKSGRPERRQWMKEWRARNRDHINAYQRQRRASLR